MKTIIRRIIGTILVMPLLIFVVGILLYTAYVIIAIPDMRPVGLMILVALVIAAAFVHGSEMLK